MTDIAGLVERLEAATEGSRELDGEIAAAFNQVPPQYQKRSASQTYLWSDGRPGLHARSWTPPNYSTSADAAMAFAQQQTGSWWSPLRTAVEVIGRTTLPVSYLPRFILIALLKALEQKATAP